MASAAMSGDAHFFEETTSPAKVRQYLDTNKEPEKLKGMKWLLAMMSKGRDVSEFFPDVVKNVVVKSVEVKKMVYMYLVHYADFDLQCREIALLSINSFQKDLAASNQLIRGLALRVMTSIRVPDIIQIQILAARKCATDSSPYVRKCAANALPKIHALDKTQIESLKQILEKLLKDTSTMVLGSAVAAFNEICPDDFEILHKSYRKLCHLLADVDEWTQISVLNVLTRYVRNQFTDSAPGVNQALRQQAQRRGANAVQGKQVVKRRVVKKAFYSDEEDESDEEEVEVVTNPEAGSVFSGGAQDVEGDLDPDHRLALKSSIPLLKSRNSGVVLAVVSLHFYCGTQSVQTGQQLAKALVRILRNQREIQYVVLKAIASMVQERPYMFRNFLQDFFIKGTDPVFARLLKLDILTALATKENVQTILRELQTYIRYGNSQFVCAVVRAVCRVAEAQPQVAHTCIEGLVHLTACTKIDDVLGEALIAIRQLLQQAQGVLERFKTSNNNAAAPTAITPELFSSVLRRMIRLVLKPEPVEVPMARAQIAWLMGEYYDQLSDVAADVLRVFANSFKDESVLVKTQVLNLAIKLSLRMAQDDNVQNMMTYILELARYDVDMDLRDRARYMTAMMGLAPQTSSDSNEAEVFVADEAALEELQTHAERICLPAKLPPLTLLGPVALEGLPNFCIGSLSSMVSHKTEGYQPIPDWPTVQPDPSVRDAHRGVLEEGNFGETAARDSESSGDEEDNLKTFYRAQGVPASSSSEEGDEEEEEEDEEESSNNSGSEGESDEESGSEEDSENAETESESEEERVTKVRLLSKQPASQSKAQQPATTGPTIVRGSIRRVQPGSKQAKGSSGQSSDIFADMMTDDLTKLSVPATQARPSSAGAGSLLEMIGENPSDSGDLLTSAVSEVDQLNQPIVDADGKGGDDVILAQIMESFNLGGVPETPSPRSAAREGMQAERSAQMQAVEERLSPMKKLIRHEVGGGVQLEYRWRHHGRVNPTRPTNQSILFVLTNKRDHPARRVRLSMQPDIPCTPLPEIPVIPVGESVQLPADFDIGGAPRPIRLELRNDRGVFNATFTPEAYELIQPPGLPMSRAEFEASKARLGGFSTSSAAFQISDNPADYERLPSKILETLHLLMLPGSYEDTGEALFVGFTRKGTKEEKVLVQLQVDERTGAGTLQVSCDDALLCPSVIEVLKKSVVA